MWNQHINSMLWSDQIYIHDVWTHNQCIFTPTIRSIVQSHAATSSTKVKVSLAAGICMEQIDSSQSSFSTKYSETTHSVHLVSLFVTWIWWQLLHSNCHINAIWISLNCEIHCKKWQESLDTGNLQHTGLVQNKECQSRSWHMVILLCLLVHSTAVCCWRKPCYKNLRMSSSLKIAALVFKVSAAMRYQILTTFSCRYTTNVNECV